MNTECTANPLVLQVIADRYILLFFCIRQELHKNETDFHALSLHRISLDGFIY